MNAALDWLLAGACIVCAALMVLKWGQWFGAAGWCVAAYWLLRSGAFENKFDALCRLLGRKHG